MVSPPYKQPKRQQLPDGFQFRQVATLLESIDQLLARLVAIFAKLALLMMLMSAMLSFSGFPPTGLSPELIGRLVRCTTGLASRGEVPSRAVGEHPLDVQSSMRLRPEKLLRIVSSESVLTSSLP
jgi:hypothetical protein